jgi:hypothetical protein
MLLSGSAVMPFDSGAAKAEVASSAPAPAMSDIASFFIMVSG